MAGETKVTLQSELQGGSRIPAGPPVARPVRHDLDPLPKSKLGGKFGLCHLDFIPAFKRLFAFLLSFGRRSLRYHLL
jgi:hypothetical protein